MGMTFRTLTHTRMHSEQIDPCFPTISVLSLCGGFSDRDVLERVVSTDNLHFIGISHWAWDEAYIPCIVGYCTGPAAPVNLRLR